MNKLFEKFFKKIDRKKGTEKRKERRKDEKKGGRNKGKDGKVEKEERGREEGKKRENKGRVKEFTLIAFWPFLLFLFPLCKRSILPLLNIYYKMAALRTLLMQHVVDIFLFLKK